MFAIAFPVVFYLLYTGVLSGAAADRPPRSAGIPWRTYFMVSMATYGAIGAALGGAIVIAQERDGGWARQLRVTPLPSSGYVAGKLVVAYLVTVPAIAAVLRRRPRHRSRGAAGAGLADRARDAGGRRRCRSRRSGS